MADTQVLIADADPERAARLAEALGEAGTACGSAPDGPRALEAALASPPGVIVAGPALPLIDGAQLSAILAANPRTRSTRFVFLGGEGPAPGASVALAADVAPGDVVQAIVGLLEQQSRIEAVDAGLAVESPTATVRRYDGTFGELTPADLLEMLHVKRASGRLTLGWTREDGGRSEGFVWLEEGELHGAATGRVLGEKALFRILGWAEGRFRFEPEPIAQPASIRSPLRSLLSEAARQQDEARRLAVPALDAPVRLCVEPGDQPRSVHPLTQEVLTLLETADRVEDVVEASSHPDHQVLRTLQTLFEREWVEFGRAEIAGPRTPDAGLFDAAQIRRLRRFAHAAPGEGGGADGGGCKLLVAGTPDRVERFGALLESVPGAVLAPAFARGEDMSRELGPMGRIDVEGDFGLDFVHVPLDEAFAPIWPFAGHRALGTILLLDVEVGTAVETLAPLARAVGAREDARTFHVVLLDAGQRLSPDALRENLSLIDEASLFLLPIEPDKDPGSLLRSLFARIVP